MPGFTKTGRDGSLQVSSLGVAQPARELDAPEEDPEHTFHTLGGRCCLTAS